MKFEARHASQLTLNRRALNFRGWLHTALQPLIAYRLESKTIHNYSKTPKDLKAKLEWVYGIRTGDVRRCLQYTVGRQAALSTGSMDKYERKTRVINEEIIFFIASVVVLLNPAICQQRHYIHHEQQVISCAVSHRNGSIIATGEIGDAPAIHIWNSRTLESLNIIKGLHTFGVHLLAFTNDDSMIVSCGLT